VKLRRTPAIARGDERESDMKQCLDFLLLRVRRGAAE
jgi:hypothetical protein